MKLTLPLVSTVLLFNGCSQDSIILKPTLHPVYAQINKLSDCNITYDVQKDGNVTLPLTDAKCVVDKLLRSKKNTEQLQIANSANIAQMLLVNSFKGEE